MKRSDPLVRRRRHRALMDLDRLLVQTIRAERGEDDMPSRGALFDGLETCRQLLGEHVEQATTWQTRPRATARSEGAG